MKRSRVAAGVALLSVVALLGVVVWQWRGGSAGAGEPRFVGADACARCHEPEARAWRGSQHALAMQPARPGTVLGRFDGSTLTQDGLTSTFASRGDRFFVRTEGSDGAPHEYEVKYTFGVFPLQQYLVELAGGRIQPLPFAWDARPRAEGGQRWYSLDPTPRPSVTSEVHWAGRFASWNYMCADCHSTDVRKGYDAARDAFRTTYSEIDVSCEACHGPGSRHAAWGARPAWVRRLAGYTAPMPARLDERRGVTWHSDTSGAVVRSAPRTTEREIETCAQCHARRTHVFEGYAAGRRFLDHYDPELILRGLYFPDGQQRSEVYTWGSFLQSRMYAAGVTCSDCHEPHSAKPRRPGNAVCTQCHLASRYDAPAHTFHPAASAGASCVACHMPDTTYMGIDRRHDHGMRVPRPDLSVKYGVPNACTRCHIDRDARWAARETAARARRAPAGFQRFADAFAADDADAPEADSLLAAVADDASHPAIVRASALARLAEHPGERAVAAARRGARDRSPLVRRGTLDAADALPARERIAIAAPLLADSIRIVRMQAARLLAPLADSLPATQRGDFARAATELVESLRYNADRAQARLTLGAFYAARRQLDSAEAELRAALRFAPNEAQPYLSLAGVLAMRGRGAEAEAVLREGIARVPDDAELAYAHAAALANVGRRDDALRAIAAARARYARDPDVVRALAELEGALRR